MNRTMKVHEVRLQRRCLPFGSSEGDGRIRCPLCAIADGTTELTAVYSRTGYIDCGRCSRMSAIETSNGTPVIPFTVDTVSNRLLAVEADTLRAALAGNGNLLELVRLDDENPVVVVQYALERIVLMTQGLGREAMVQDGGKGTQSAVIDPRTVPASLRRLLDRGSSTPVVLADTKVG